MGRVDDGGARVERRQRAGRVGGQQTMREEGVAAQGVRRVMAVLALGRRRALVGRRAQGGA